MRGRVLTIVGIAILIAALSVGVITFWLWRHQERVVFQPPAAWADAPAPARRVLYKASDGHDVFGYLLSPPPSAAGADARTLVIAFHGNADLAAWTVPWARELAERTGMMVLVPEYRGYAGIAGPPTYESASADARGALAYARNELGAPEIILFGHSLGTAIATELAHSMEQADVPPRALILQSPFTSAREMGARMLVPPFPWLWRRISRVPYDTRSLVGRLDVPVHVVHGTRDLNIPARMGVQVFRAARNPGDLLLVEKAGHNDVAETGGERYWRWLVAATAAPAATAR